MSPARFDVTDEELVWRKTTGIHRWDEVWDGVWYMTPAPTLEHQRIIDEMIVFLKPLLKAQGRGLLVAGINVLQHAEGWTNYRIPDLTFVASGRERILHEDGVRASGPDAVIEIRSPGDDTYEKLPFYAAIGTREVVIVDRDTKQPQIHRLVGNHLLLVPADQDGWLTSERMLIRFRRMDAEPPRLRIEDASNSEVRVDI
jgi:Uma2 family endonuclease